MPMFTRLPATSVIGVLALPGIDWALAGTSAVAVVAFLRWKSIRRAAGSLQE